MPLKPDDETELLQLLTDPLTEDDSTPGMVQKIIFRDGQVTLIVRVIDYDAPQ